MKLLTSVLPRGRILTEDGWFTLAVCGFLIGLEVVGRYAALTDFHDGLAGFALIMGVAAIVARHRRAPLGWVTSLTNWCQRIGATFANLRYDHGIDLRGTPPITRRTPPAVWVLAVALIVWSGLAVASWTAFPTGWRTVGMYSSYTLYLGFLMVLWSALLTVTFVGVFVPVAVLDSLLKRWLGDTDRRGAELAAVVGYAVLVSAVAWVVPPAAILGLCIVVAIGSWIVYLPKGTDGPAVLWRSGADKPVYAVPVRRVLSLVSMLAALLMFAILITSCGGRLFDPPRADDTMPVTALFGAIAAWLVPILVVVVALRLWAARRNDPARRTRPTAHIAGEDRAEIRRAVKILRTWGYSVRTSAKGRENGQVGIVIVPPEQSEAKEFDPRWPLKVSVDDLIAGEVKQRFDRRDEIQVRRQLFRGLQKLFKRASVFKGPGGGGFWLAPHWWFVEGVGREDSDASGEDAAPPLVGPPYARAIPERARQHAHAVLRATGVDMIFIEDGVTFKGLDRVLRVVTELYDVHAGQRKAEEHHFRGVPKVKVMIHEYEPGNPFQSDAYPEPKFDDLSRVRVLHIFRDRGGEEELIEPPYDFSWTPAPALMG
ncbi:MAG: hypothetical protein C0467_08915 [Planctomycetaceae bacterium]|nr:hypothetical protein [Planctomycetaceae bacterium]